MTPAFRSFFCWVILLLTGSNLIIAQSSSGRPLSKAIWITDKVISELPDTLTILQPLYDNQYQTRRVLPIRYLVKSVGKRAWLKNWSKGTFLCSWQSIKEDTLSSVNILDRPGVFQLIKRDSGRLRWVSGGVTDSSIRHAASFAIFRSSKPICA